MDTLIGVAFGLAVVCFILYKNREKLSALYDKIQKPESVTSVPEVGTVAPNLGTPYKVEPVSQPLTTGSNPQTQEEWTEYRNSQAPSTRAYIPEKFTPEHTASGDKVEPGEGAKVNRLKPITLPKSWGGERIQSPCNFKGGVKNSCVMKVSGAVSTSPAVNDPAGGAVEFSASLDGKPLPSRGVYNNWKVQAGTLEITASRDCQVNLMMVKALAKK